MIIPFEIIKKKLLYFPRCFLQLLYYTSVNSNEIRQKRTAVFPLRSFYDVSPSHNPLNLIISQFKQFLFSHSCSWR